MTRREDAKGEWGDVGERGNICRGGRGEREGAIDGGRSEKGPLRSEKDSLL
jgi:hypothetical protein